MKRPPAVEEMAQFKNDLLLLLKNVEFKKVNNDFQMRLRDDINEIKASNKMVVSADKSRHIYKIEKDEYKKLLRENITQTYKKLNGKKLRDINFAGKKIAAKYQYQIINSRSSRVLLRTTRMNFQIKYHAV